MVSDDKKAKTSPAPKNEPAAKDKTALAADAPKAKGAETAAAPDKAKDSEKPTASSYSRGEGQKPVSQAYKDNWNAIFAKKKKR